MGAVLVLVLVLVSVLMPALSLIMLLLLLLLVFDAGFFVRSCCCSCLCRFSSSTPEPVKAGPTILPNEKICNSVAACPVMSLAVALNVFSGRSIDIDNLSR